MTVTGAATARIRDDLITGNTGLGIDLGNDGVTANDALDADTGPNSLQNFPVLASVRREGGGLRVRGTISVPASGLLQIDVYESTDCVAGIGEGAQLLGTIERRRGGRRDRADQRSDRGRPAGRYGRDRDRHPRRRDLGVLGLRRGRRGPGDDGDDHAPTSQAVLEGGSAAFTVHRSGDTSGSADVAWSTHAGSATAPADYAVAGGTVHFASGERTSRSASRSPTTPAWRPTRRSP